MHNNPFLMSAKTIVSVEVEYTSKGARVVKIFTGARAVSASRAFYKAKMVAGATPKVVGASRNHP